MPSLLPQTVMTPLTAIHPNPDNPRVIKDKQFKSLCKSLKEFPQMLTLRPLVTTADGTIIGGNQRYEAAKSIGITEIPVVCADRLTPEQVKRFVVVDNLPFGEFDMDALANGWDMEELVATGFPESEMAWIDFDDGEKPKVIEISTRPPDLAWVIVSIPIKEYGKISNLVDSIANTAGVHCEIGMANDEG